MRARQYDYATACYAYGEDRGSGRGHRGEQQVGSAGGTGHREKTGNAAKVVAMVLRAAPAIGSR